jgi:DNA-binding HxlR family transcriptional regulator
VCRLNLFLKEFEQGTFLCRQGEDSLMERTNSKLDTIRDAVLKEAGPRAEAELVALTETMRREGAGRDDPVREIFALLGDRWSTLILVILAIGPWRHAMLRRIVGTLSIEGAISQRVITLKLRALERDGLVKRTATSDIPPRVDYELTVLGRSLVGEIERLIEWVRTNRSAIDEARLSFQEVNKTRR